MPPRQLRLHTLRLSALPFFRSLLEFFVSLINCQPMGFYLLETLKEAARCFGAPFLNPCVIRALRSAFPSRARCC